MRGGGPVVTGAYTQLVEPSIVVSRRRVEYVERIASIFSLASQFMYQESAALLDSRQYSYGRYLLWANWKTTDSSKQYNITDHILEY